MMRRWLICFSAALLATACAGAATVSGMLQITGGTRKPRALTDIVVWLESEDNPATPAPPRHAQMLQKDKMFHPHVLAIEVGTIVDFPNADPIFHNAFSNYEGQLFDVSLYPPGTSRSVTFHKPGVVRVFCNIHPSMSAIILVLKNPYFAKVSAGGSYRIPNVPPGRYDLHFYDERADSDKQETPKLVVDNTEAVSPVLLHISESRFTGVPPHKNKFGQDYPKDAGSYSGEMGPPK